MASDHRSWLKTKSKLKRLVPVLWKQSIDFLSSWYQGFYSGCRRAPECRRLSICWQKVRAPGLQSKLPPSLHGWAWHWRKWTTGPFCLPLPSPCRPPLSTTLLKNSSSAAQPGLSPRENAGAAGPVCCTLLTTIALPVDSRSRWNQRDAQIDSQRQIMEGHILFPDHIGNTLATIFLCCFSVLGVLNIEGSTTFCIPPNPQPEALGLSPSCLWLTPTACSLGAYSMWKEDLELLFGWSW